MFAARHEQRTVEPVQVLQGTVKLPGSKSLSNRILLLASLAEGTTDIENLLVHITARTLQQPVSSCASAGSWPAGRSTMVYVQTFGCQKCSTESTFCGVSGDVSKDVSQQYVMTLDAGQ
jgi:5-enolpyruvylshikimate-3-phosphate synthase